MSEPYDVCRQVIAMLDSAGPDTAEIGHVRNVIREAGIEPDQHVGDPRTEHSARMTAEWWLGQVADIIDREGWFAMNSLLNWGHSHFDKTATP